MEETAAPACLLQAHASHLLHFTVLHWLHTIFILAFSPPARQRGHHATPTVIHGSLVMIVSDYLPL